MKIVRFFFVLLGIGLMFVLGFGYGRWYSTRPAATKSARKVLYYVDPMHTWYKSNKPGIAPDCGMKLEPVYADSAGAGEHDSDAPPNAVKVSAEQQHAIGVRFGEAEWTAGGETIHASGKVMADETRVTKVQSRTDGWITEVKADFIGKFVTKGEPMLSLYSPELLAAQQEYLLAQKAKGILSHSSMEESAANSETLAEAARRRLFLLNMDEDQIAQVDRTQKPVQSIVVYAPVSGYVTARNAFPGQRITAETDLYTLVDLSGVWVTADVFEMDARRIRVGLGAHVSIPGQNASTFARVTYIQPQVDAASRTMKVRLELANPKMQLLPDMWVNADIELGGTRRLSVPASAVLDAGTTKTVFVDRGNGYFEPRAVETGARFTDASGDRVEITKGLKAGERIVTSGTFLMNSESQMKSPGTSGGMADMPGMDHSATPHTGHEPEGKP